jgi:hypothetical protein
VSDATSGLANFTARSGEAMERAKAMVASGISWTSAGSMLAQFILGGMTDLEESPLPGANKRSLLSAGVKDILATILPVLPIPGLPPWANLAVGIIRPLLRSVALSILADLLTGVISGTKSQLKSMGVFGGEPKPAISPQEPAPETIVETEEAEA